MGRTFANFQHGEAENNFRQALLMLIAILNTWIKTYTSFIEPATILFSPVRFPLDSFSRGFLVSLEEGLSVASQDAEGSKNYKLLLNM